MGMKSKRILLAALVMSLALLLCGCRVRTNGSQEATRTDTGEQWTDETKPGEVLSGEAGRTESGEGGENGGLNESGEAGETGGQTRENPEASRKEYDENAQAEIVPGTEHLLHEAGEGNGASAANEDSEDSVNQVNDRAEETAVRRTAAEEAEQKGVSEDADAADSALTYYTVLLQDKTGSLFECQRLNVYWETEQDHVTIHKSSPEHQLILNAGCYDVSARLLPENLRVDDGWVGRKNPGVIVKMVDSGILGSGVGSDRAARAVYERLQNREGWADIDGVKNRRILLLSREMLEAPYLQTAAMVLIAGTANPSLFTDTDPDRMIEMLTEEATGALPAGIFYYRKDEP